MPLTTVHPVLMSLLRGSMDAAPAPLPADADAWSRLVADAADHGLTALLYKWLHESGAACRLPPALLDEIKGRVFGLAARNLTLAGELRAILLASQQQGVTCIPIRGLALAEQLYGDLTIRPMDDIDLLVRRGSLDEIGGILRSLGFHQIDVRQGFAREYYYTLEFEKQGLGSILVEPHWTIAYPPFMARVDMEQVWRRSRPGRVVGVQATLLDRADLFLHLCCHLMHWRERAPLLWFFELDQLIRQDASGIDWAQVVHTARQSGQALLIARALQAIEPLFYSPIPGHVIQELARPPSSRDQRSIFTSFERRVVELLAGDSDLRGREQFALFFATKGLWAKFRYAWGLLFPSAKFMRFRYGPASGPALLFQYMSRSLSILLEGVRWTGDLLSARARRL